MTPLVSQDPARPQDTKPGHREVTRVTKATHLASAADGPQSLGDLQVAETVTATTPNRLVHWPRLRGRPEGFPWVFCRALVLSGLVSIWSWRCCVTRVSTCVQCHCEHPTLARL